MQILPFNFNHSKRAGEFARIVFEKKNLLNLNKRNIIPNDTNLFAQADCEMKIEYYLTSDIDSKKIYDLLNSDLKPKFQFIDLNIPSNESFGNLF